MAPLSRIAPGLRLRLSVVLGLLTLLAYAAGFPFLYRSLYGIVARSHEQLFVEDSRTFARLLAQQLELGGAFDSPKLVANALDTAILNGSGVYAELDGPGLDVHSELNQPGLPFPAREDLRFGEGSDTTYFIKTPVWHRGRAYELRLGFDERPTIEIVEGVRGQVFWTLAACLGVLTLAGFWLGHLVTRPLARLQRLSRQVSADPHSASLQLATPVAEVAALARDLQAMRMRLVATSESLRAQISAREAAEQERATAELERAALERQLQHRERLQTVGTLAGGIAHEINNALVPITLLTELSMRDPTVGERARKDLGTVLSAARQARHLLRQILTFGRSLDASELQLHDLGALVEEALSLFRPLASRNVQIGVHLEPGCPRVLADRGLVAQLVMNLCTNAQQALPAGTGHIDVSVRSSGAREVQLEVRDDGRGMDEATLARVFEPFYTTRPVGEGTGLGLAVVHGIVEELGARVHVESRPGEGSVFSIHFPVVPGSD